MKRRKQMFVGTFKGKVKSIVTKKFYLSVVIDCLADDNKTHKPNTFRIYDSNIPVFKNTISKGDYIIGECACDLYDKNAKTYNKIRNFTKLKIKDNTKNEVKQNRTNSPVFMMAGTITNLKNPRDSKQKSDIAFCFKSEDKKKVDYITANDLFSKSSFFKKNQKVLVEVIEEERSISRNNRTLRLINMWGRY